MIIRYFESYDETGDTAGCLVPYVLYEDHRQRMREALAYMQAILNNERLAYERYRSSLKEDLQEMHEHRHKRTQDIINHLREGLL